MADKVDLIANRSMTYMTRQLVAEDPFEAKPREAKILVAIGKARLVGTAAPAAKPKAPTPKPKAPRGKPAAKPKA